MRSAAPADPADNDAAAAYARGLRDAAAFLVMDNQTIRLHAGELSEQEMRVVRAVLKWKWRELVARAEKEFPLQAQDPA